MEGAAAAPAARVAKPARKPNVLFVTFDTTRADHCSAFGYDRPTTPRMEALLPTAVRFTSAYAPTTVTLPSHATALTGLLPRSLGVLRNGERMGEDVVTLAEVLREAGYRTAAVVSSLVLSRRFGIAQGFETFFDSFEGSLCDSRRPGPWQNTALEDSFCRRGDETFALAQAWLASSGYLGGPGQREETAPFFLWVHLFDPHSPYRPVAEHAALFPPRGKEPTKLDRQIAAYDAEIHYADAQVGRLLDRLAAAGALDDTLLVITADHGEGLMQHGWMNHGPYIYEEIVRVPLVVRWPGELPGGRTIDAPVGLVDLPATVLDLVGLAGRLPAGDGRSLAPLLLGRAEPDPERPVLLQRRRYKSRRTRGLPVKGLKLGVRVGDLKYIEARAEGTRELYDLSSDPGELVNLVGARPDDARRLAEILAAWVATPTGHEGSQEIPDEDAERLRALGYVE